MRLAWIVLLSLALVVPVSADDPPLFEDVTEATGLSEFAATRAAVADLDGDGWPDAILGGTAIYWNRPAEGGGRRFVRTAADRFLTPEKGRAPDLVQFGDADGDGRLDVFVGRITDLDKADFVDDGLRDELWLGRADGGFVRVEDSGLGGRTETPLSAAWVDFDLDGRLDLFVGQAFRHWGTSDEACPNRLFRGLGGGRFEDVTGKAGLLGVALPGRADSRRATFGVACTDFDDDGRPDLLALSYGRLANRLYRNQGDGTFTDVGPETTFDGDDLRDGRYLDVVKEAWARQGYRLEDEPPWRVHGNTFDCAVGDPDGDGDMDLFLGEIAHGWAGPSSDPSMLLVNLGKEGGWRFRREPGAIRRQPSDLNANTGDQHVAWADVDNDGRLDLWIASSDYPDEQVLQLYHQTADGRFEDWTPRLGFRWVNAIQIGLGDHDRDGAIDVLVSRWHMRLTPEQQKAHPVRTGLFRNLAAARAGNGFVAIRLEGTGPGGANREAIGARVSIWIDGRRQTREVSGGHGCGASHDDTECHFGAGKAATIDRLEVRWPDAKGTVQVFEKVAANRFYRLRQGGELRAADPR